MIVYDALVSEPDSKIYLDNITVLNENCSGSYRPGKASFIKENHVEFNQLKVSQVYIYYEVKVSQVYIYYTINRSG